MFANRYSTLPKPTDAIRLAVLSCVRVMREIETVVPGRMEERT